MKKILCLLAVITIWLSASSFAVEPDRPDPMVTPGEANSPPTSLEILCKSGYSRAARHVSRKTKKEVFIVYGLDQSIVNRREYQVDHLIPLELDGSNNIKNLWPQKYNTHPFSAYKKDALENKLHHMVCDGEIDLFTAQKEISEDWMAAYKKYVTKD